MQTFFKNKLFIVFGLLFFTVVTPAIASIYDAEHYNNDVSLNHAHFTPAKTDIMPFIVSIEESHSAPFSVIHQTPKEETDNLSLSHGISWLFAIIIAFIGIGRGLNSNILRL